MDQLWACDEENKTIEGVGQEDAKSNCWDTEGAFLVPGLAQLADDEGEQTGEQEVKEQGHVERLYVM